METARSNRFVNRVSRCPLICLQTAFVLVLPAEAIVENSSSSDCTYLILHGTTRDCDCDCDCNF